MAECRKLAESKNLTRLAGVAAIPTILIRHSQSVPYVPENFCFADVSDVTQLIFEPVVQATVTAA
jgi:hypothetical protein